MPTNRHVFNEYCLLHTMNKIARQEEVRRLMLNGESAPLKIAQIINAKHNSVTQRKTIESDMQEIKQRNESWAKSIMSGDSLLQMEQYFLYIAEDIEILQSTMRELAKDKITHSYRIAQIFPNLKAALELQIMLNKQVVLLQAKELNLQLSKEGEVKAIE